MSDIRATLRQKFEAKFPVPDGATFNGDNYVCTVEGDSGFNRDRVVKYRYRWQTWQAAYADAVRDCAETVAYRKTSGGDGPINRQLNIIIEEILELAP